ncbi:MAG TPA: DUF1800 domain-containing protein [Pyrinomonadaceae bacterium]|nr:DUF1800 domain-containing protein [Pyrinomonadaceae bacterium]
MKRNYSVIHKITAFLMVLAMCAPVFAFGGKSLTDKKGKALTEDQKILHVLNRLGFGARPGDVERVKAMGLDKYIEQQLNPNSISDSVAEMKVKNLEVFNMTTAEVFAKYPNPGALLRQLEGGKNNQAANNANNNQNNQNADQQMTDKDRQERQAKLREYYKEYDLRPAAQLLPQITSNRVLRAVYSEKQLQEVMVDFWQNHFNVYAGKAAVRWYIPSYERDVLRKNALGNFKDLVVGTAQHPAMLFYLDNFESMSPNAQNNNNRGNGLLQRMMQNGQLTPQQRERIKQQRGLTDEQLDQRLKQMQNQKKQKRGINENYARELMELHTLGVDGGYTQADIIEVAKAFTGWTIADPRGYRKAAANEIKGAENKQLNRLQRLPGVPDDIESGEFYFNKNWHEDGTKTVLGQKINEGGMKDGLKVIDILVSQPATAKFIARKLAVKFVSDNPSEQLVARVAKAFQDSKGDIKTTLKAIFTDKEFYAPENYRAKIKTPFELAVSAIRTIGADTNSGGAILAMLNKLGEVPYGYQAPTGYPDTAEDWVNAGALLERLNFAVALASNQIPGTKADLKMFEAGSKSAILDKTIAVILDNDISPGTKATLLKQIELPLPDVKSPDEVEDNLEVTNMRQGQGNRMNRQARLLAPSGNAEVFKVVSLVLGTPEFQRQ